MGAQSSWFGSRLAGRRSGSNQELLRGFVFFWRGWGCLVLLIILRWLLLPALEDFGRTEYEWFMALCHR